MQPSRVWLLNFDAEEELEDPSRTTPRAAVSARFPELAGRVGDLLGPSDFVLDEAAPGPARGRAGRAWCPTPRALATLERAGATAPAAPSYAVLRRANHRAFSAELGQTLPGARYVRSWSELESVLASAPPDAPWLLKRAFGFAGRGRRRVTTRDVDAAARGWVEASLCREGLQVEPWVERRGDFALHGHLSQGGELQLGRPTLQEVTESGAWCRSVVAPPGVLAEDELDALVGEARRAAEHLRAAGYFGPFGLDAFRWKAPDGTTAYNPRSEINARYSMGWSVGMGSVRPDL